MSYPKMQCEDLTPAEMISAAKRNELAIQQDLINKCKSIQQRNFYQSRLISLCHNPEPELINRPLDKKNGWTPLMLAVLYHDQLTDLQKVLGEAPYVFLIKQGADVNKTNCFSMTPLMITAFTKDTQVAQTLIHSGANINATNYHDETAAHLVYQEGNFSSDGCTHPFSKKLLQLLINEGADTSLRSYTQLCLEDEETKNILEREGILLKKTSSQSSFAKARLHIPKITDKTL